MQKNWCIYLNARHYCTCIYAVLLSYLHAVSKSCGLNCWALGTTRLKIAYFTQFNNKASFGHHSDAVGISEFMTGHCFGANGASGRLCSASDPSHHGRSRSWLHDRWVRRLRHVPHAVLCSAQERLRGAEGTSLQNRGDVHLQDRQARTC